MERQGVPDVRRERTERPMSNNDTAPTPLDTAATSLRAGDEIQLKGLRRVRVATRRDGVTVAVDSRGRVAVRNAVTNRLSYIPERVLRAALATPSTATPELRYAELAAAVSRAPEKLGHRALVALAEAHRSDSEDRDEHEAATPALKDETKALGGER